MTTSRRWRRSARIVACLLGMLPLALVALVWLGVSVRAAVLGAIALACAVAALYAWWLAQRAARPLDGIARSRFGRTP